MSSAKPGYQRDFLTPEGSFYEVTRGMDFPTDGGRRVRCVSSNPGVH